jgi:sugar lactone lactonase YvrE
MSRPAPGRRNRRRPAAPDILVDAHAALGEGPVWDDQQQRLLWVEIFPGLVLRFDLATGGDEVFRVGKPVGAVGLRREGGLVIAVEDGFALLDQGWQRLHQVAVIKHARPRARFNDGKCDPAGRFLAGTMAYDLTPGAGSLYRLDPDRSVTRLLPGVTISNGLAWTGSGATLYYIDSPTQGIDAFDYDLGTGRLANRRRLVEIPPDAGLPDGMAIDEDGCLWVALYGGSAVRRYTPAGKLDATLFFPATNITCPVFGGPGFGVLYVTSARDGLDNRQLAAQPHAGAVFAADVGSRGLPTLRFGG